MKVKDEREAVQSRSKVSDLNVGDFVLALRPEFLVDTHRPGPVRKKLLHRTHDVVYQVHHKLSSSSFIVRAAGTGAGPEGFSNPVNLSRLIRATTWFVREPEGESRKVMEALDDDAITWKRGAILGYGYNASMRVKFDGEAEETWIDLTREQYRWVV